MSPKKNATESFKKLVDNRYFFGITLLLVTVGSKYLNLKLSPAQEAFFKLWYVRCIIFFCIFFSSTKDFKLSLFLVIFFYVVFNTLLNEDSKVCVLPNEARKEGNKEESRDEYERCKEVIKNYES